MLTIYNQGITGSIPSGPTMKIKELQLQKLQLFFYAPGFGRNGILWSKVASIYYDILIFISSNFSSNEPKKYNTK